jgi:multiple inositol-polyphosphate phosphatase/2,3-bisphosphoglycerate 3-phosphatase
LEDLNENQAKNLHPEGEKELLLMAERFQERFPYLLTGDYHEESFKFRATNTQRAQQSQFYFATGLFNKQIAYKVRPSWSIDFGGNIYF